MRKRWIRISPYVIGLIAPILFAAWAPTVSEKTKGTLLIWLTVHFLLTAAVDVISGRTGMRRALGFSLQLWLNLFVQVFLRCLIDPDSLVFFDRLRMGCLFLLVTYLSALILGTCFGNRKPLPKGKNVLRLTLLMLIMPAVLMGVGVVNLTVFLIGLGWALVTLLIMILQVATDPGALPEDGDMDTPPEKDAPGGGLIRITAGLTRLGIIAAVVLAVVAVGRVERQPREATAEEIAYYSRYEMDAKALTKAAGTGNVKDAVLHFCEFEKSEEIAGKTWETYAPKGLEAFLPEAKTVVDVGGAAETDTVVIYYVAKDGREVRLTYGIDEKGEAFAQNTVYDAGTDTLYEGHGEIHRMYFKFRNGG